MPVGKLLDAHDTLRLALGQYYKSERDRTERCLGDIIDILANAEPEHQQVVRVLGRLTDHYSGAAPPANPTGKE